MYLCLNKISFMKKVFPYIFSVLLLFISLNTFATFCNTAGSLVSVKKTKSGHTEYVIFTIKKPTNVKTTVSNATPPFIEDASGNTLTIQGCKYKQLVLNGVDWTCTIHEYLSNATSLIRQVKRTGQFEGVISYVVGYKCNPASKFVFYSYSAGAYMKYVMRFRY